MKPTVDDIEKTVTTEQQGNEEQHEDLFEEFDLDDIEVIESKVFA
jgi:hypothetical protein